jgi:hypothetical protein
LLPAPGICPFEKKTSMGDAWMETTGFILCQWWDLTSFYSGNWEWTLVAVYVSLPPVPTTISSYSTRCTQQRSWSMQGAALHGKPYTTMYSHDCAPTVSPTGSVSLSYLRSLTTKLDDPIFLRGSKSIYSESRDAPRFPATNKVLTSVNPSGTHNKWCLSIEANSFMCWEVRMRDRWLHGREASSSHGSRSLGRAGTIPWQLKQVETITNPHGFWTKAAHICMACKWIAKGRENCPCSVGERLFLSLDRLWPSAMRRILCRY